MFDDLFSLLYHWILNQHELVVLNDKITFQYYFYAFLCSVSNGKKRKWTTTETNVAEKRGAPNKKQLEDRIKHLEHLGSTAVTGLNGNKKTNLRRN